MHKATICTVFLLTYVPFFVSAITEYIRSEEQFIEFTNKVSSGSQYSGTTVFLTCDLDLTGKNFVPVGPYQINHFKGSFNGNGYLLRGINFVANKDIQFVGLFGYVYTGKISDIVLDSTNYFESTYTGRFNLDYAGCAVGSVVGRCYDCTIENVASTASLAGSGEYSSATSGVRRFGGIVGCSHGTMASIKNAAFAGIITFQGTGTRQTTIGGLAGFMEGTKLINAVNLGKIIDKKTASGTVSIDYIAYPSAKSSSNTFDNCFSSIKSGHGKIVNEYYNISGTSETLLGSLNSYSSANGLKKWCSVIHIPNGGSAISNHMSFLTYIDSELKPSEKEGNTFAGWFTNYILSNPWESRGAVKVFGSTNTYVYAKWTKNNYTISFDTNGGLPMDDMTVAFDEILNIKDPTFDGKVFYGWTEQIGDSNGEPYAFNLPRMPARNITLVAMWGDKPCAKIFFNTTGGTEISSIRIPINDTIDLGNVSTPEKRGHSFVHWYEQGKYPEDEFNLTKMPDRDINLCAKWETLTYLLNYSGVKTYNLNFNDNIPEETAEKIGYNFVYWYEETPEVQFSEIMMPDRDITLLPLLEPIVYTLTLEFYDGHPSFSDRFVCCKSFILPVPIREGYNFAKWYNNTNYAGDPFDSSVMPSNNITLYAKWEPLCYIMSFDTDGGSSVNDIKFCYNEGHKNSSTILPAEVPKKPGYAFEYWYEVNETIPFNFSVVSSKNITLHAKWTNASAYLAITFDGSHTLEDITEEMKKYTNEFEILSYNSESGSTQVIVRFRDETASREFVRNIKNDEFFRNAEVGYVNAPSDNSINFSARFAPVPAVVFIFCFSHFF